MMAGPSPRTIRDEETAEIEMAGMKSAGGGMRGMIERNFKNRRETELRKSPPRDGDNDVDRDDRVICLVIITVADLSRWRE